MSFLVRYAKRMYTAASRSAKLSERLHKRGPPIKITPAAAERIKELLSSKNNNSDNKSKTDGIRIGVKKGGCNGLEYTMDYNTPNINDKMDDLIINEYDVKVVLENRALFYMMGSTIDFKSDDLRSGFTFDNPNVTSQCGCENSFSV
mmetsp:Transcript_79006/g.96594  ORF Transcript_79006/g.96594 Transcript_79006/m.96594 type:complete len:147 (+) Transcript_79006:49-489(+)